MYEVPSDIGRLVNLKILMLDTNCLRDLPFEICQLQLLERISLSNNFLTELPNISQLQKLRSLHLSNNKYVIVIDFSNFVILAAIKQLYIIDLI